MLTICRRWGQVLPQRSQTESRLVTLLAQPGNHIIQADGVKAGIHGEKTGDVKQQTPDLPGQASQRFELIRPPLARHQQLASATLQGGGNLADARESPTF